MILIVQRLKQLAEEVDCHLALNHTRSLCSHVRYVFYLLRDGLYRVDLPEPPGRDAKAVHIVESSNLKDFAVKPQSKRIIYFNDTAQVFMSTFLDGSASHLVLPQVPFDDVKSFACENNDFLVTDGKAIFQQDTLSFNEFIVGCDLSHIEEFGFGNLVIFGSSIQPHPLPGRPQELSVLFGSHQALVQWKPPALAIGASEYTVPWVATGFTGRRGGLDCLALGFNFESPHTVSHQPEAAI